MAIVDCFLKDNPNLDLKVHTIWLPMYRKATVDQEYGVVPGMMKAYSDKRYVHYWDANKSQCRLFKKKIRRSKAVSQER